MTGIRRRNRATLKARTDQAVPEEGWECEMLAYLDYCLLSGPDHRRFRRTVLTHLEKLIPKTWTLKNIDKSIRVLWRQLGVNGINTCDHESIYHFGTKVLRCPPDDPDFKDRISIRKDEIQQKKFDAHYTLKSRTTRSAHINSHISLGNEFPERGIRWASRQTTSEAPIRQPTAEFVQDEHDSGLAADTHELIHDAHSSHVSHVDSFIPDSNDSQSVSRRSSSSVSSGDELLNANPEYSDSALEKVLESTESRDIERLCSNATTTIDSEEKSFLELDIDHHLQGELAELRRRVAFCQKELRSSEKHNADLKLQLESERDTRAIVESSDKDSMARRLERYINEIKILKSQLAECKRLGRFTNPRHNHPIGHNKKDIQIDMNLIETGILNLWAFPETMSCNNKAESNDKDEDLSHLCCEAFGGSGKLPNDVPFQSILRSLTSVAVCKWVFKSEFDPPYFANSCRGEALLDVLAASDGENVARNLNFAALASLIESDYCQQDLLPAQAVARAERLSIALTPLFVIHGKLCKWSDKLTKRFEKERNSLVEIFLIALKIKAKTLVGEWTYEAILPSSGDQYDELLMRPEGPHSSTSHVRLVLAPGLCRYERENMRADCNIFGHLESTHKPGFDRVQRALVRLQ